MRRVRYHMKRFILPLAIGLLLLSGCSRSGGGSTDNARPLSASDGAPERKTDADAPQAAQPGTAQPGAAQPGAATTAPNAPVEGRSLIFRAEITVKVDDVQKASDAAASLVATAGGFVASEKRSIDARESHSTITLRVPSKQYAEALEKLAKLGREVSRSSNVEDVTEAIVDLDTRIAAQKASVESVRKMFERATSLSDVVLLEKELSHRQTELATLEAKKRRVDDLVALSTITLTLAGPNTVIEPEKEPDPSFLGGLKNGWKALMGSLKLASAVLGFLLPFLAVIGIPLFALIYFLRLHRRRVRPEPDQSGS
jgi:Domain of unknown function (DUF4349)